MHALGSYAYHSTHRIDHLVRSVATSCLDPTVRMCEYRYMWSLLWEPDTSYDFYPSTGYGFCHIARQAMCEA